MSAPAGQQLGFVLHLGDFIYEVVEYPDEVQHRYARTVYDLGRIPDARKVSNFHVPTNLAGYRHVYRAHIDDPDMKPWVWADYGSFRRGDFSAALSECAEICDLVRDHKVTGFVTVSGDRHSFWAGYAARALPPAKFEPVGLSFITGSISAPELAEAMEYGLQKHPLRSLFCVERPGKDPEATISLTLKHGVKSALEYAASGDIAKARALTNPGVAPHLEFVDMAGHG